MNRHISNPVGLEIVAGLSGIDKKIGENTDYIVNIVKNALSRDGLTVVGTTVHRQKDRTIDILTLISESHCILKIIPDGRVEFDLYSCKDERSGKKAYSIIKDALGLKEEFKQENPVYVSERMLVNTPKYSQTTPIGNRFMAVLSLFGDQFDYKNLTKIVKSMHKKVVAETKCDFKNKKKEVVGMSCIYLGNDGSQSNIHTYHEYDTMTLSGRFQNEAQSRKSLDNVIGVLMPLDIYIIEPKVLALR